MTNPSLNEQVFWSLLVNQETDVFRPVFLGFSWHFPDACCLTVERWPLHFQPSCRGFEQEEEERAATAGKQSFVQKPCSVDFGPCSAVASGKGQDELSPFPSKSVAPTLSELRTLSSALSTSFKKSFVNLIGRNWEANNRIQTKNKKAEEATLAGYTANVRTGLFWMVTQWVNFILQIFYCKCTSHL